MKKLKKAKVKMPEAIKRKRESGQMRRGRGLRARRRTGRADQANPRRRRGSRRETSRREGLCM